MKQKPQRQYEYPWRDGNRLQLLVDGDQFFAAMLDAIDSAQERVWLEMYLFETGLTADRFIDAFIRARKRGVDVRILLDDFGSRKLHRTDRARLEMAGIHLALYNPLRFGELRRNLFRDHRKLLIVDYHAAFVGGAGITDEFSHDTNRRNWRETMVQIKGPCLNDWMDLFAGVWALAAEEKLNLPSANRAHPVDKGVHARVTSSHGFGHQEIKRSLVKRIRSAERHIWIATAYFVPSIKISRALRSAAKRGVDVRLLLPGRYTDHPAVRHAGRRYYYRLLKNGVRVFEYQPRFLHQKVILCDSWASVGSSNIDRWNFRWNLEANQEVDSNMFARQVIDMFEHDFADSHEISLKAWSHRSFYRRWLEYFWGTVDIWLERLGLKILHRRRRDKK